MKIIAFQIDLARQLETVESIYKNIDFAQTFGYNTILLYLEDRIKTTSYPYAQTKDSYSKTQIRSIVSYANQKSINIIPVISTLGHVERFLKHPELKDLAEIKDGIQARSPEGGWPL